MKKRQSKQSSQYDKILKENLEASLPGLIANVLHIDIITSEELPDDLQHTKERKPDALKRVTDKSGQTFVLHIEFQLMNEPKMVHRMHNYCAMLMEQYSIPVRQYVFYLGPGAARMATNLTTPDLSFQYKLISFQELDYRVFLASDKPEEVLLAVLANFQPQESSTVLRQLLEKLDETATGPLILQKYVAQLRILVQLRKLQPLLQTAMDTLTKYVNEQGDPFYIKGKNSGIEQGIELGIEQGKVLARRLVAENLIVNANFTDEQIAPLINESIAFVRDVRQQIAQS